MAGPTDVRRQPLKSLDFCPVIELTSVRLRDNEAANMLARQFVWSERNVSEAIVEDVNASFRPGLLWNDHDGTDGTVIGGGDPAFGTKPLAYFRRGVLGSGCTCKSTV